MKLSISEADMKDTTPACVKAVLDKPGIYEFHNGRTLWFFEVDSRGRVHQLNPRTFIRDGILSKSGWFPEAERGEVRLYDPLRYTLPDNE